LIEVRNDLIKNQDSQEGWAEILAPILQQALDATNKPKAGE
jgi:predicted N-formylglutamate amidohydrolase